MLSSFWSNLSILATCVFLTRENKTNLGLLLSLGAIVGVFHGYADSEGIIGTENTPLFAYLCGFSLIQVIISAIAFYLGKLILLSTRFADFFICDVRRAFFSTALLT